MATQVLPWSVGGMDVEAPVDSSAAASAAAAAAAPAAAAATALAPAPPLPEGEAEPLTQKQSVQLVDVEAGATSERQLNAIQKTRITFHNITYRVTVKAKKATKSSPAVPASEKLLLDDVSGAALPGEILAIIGQSGAGKSTLLDVLAGRVRKSSIEGDILINDVPVDATFRKRAAYVMQDDALFPLLTVRETLMYSARLRLPSSVSWSDKAERVDALIAELGLKDAANTIVGDETHRGISGGERRRVSIGVDMIHDPAVIFLDEPTSGLDSKSSLRVLQMLKNLARYERTVLLTIHQPSSRIIDLIDKVIVMGKGRQIYWGPPAELAPFFAQYGRPMPAFSNLFEFALDVVDDMASSPEGVKPLAEHYKLARRSSMEGYDAGLLTESAQERKREAVSGAIPKTVEDDPNPYATNFFHETMTLSNRIFINNLRTPELFLARVGLSVITGLILGTLFLQLGDTYTDFQSYRGFIAFAGALLIFTSTDALPVFLQERTIFTRETTRGAYRIESYVLAHTYTSLPVFAVISFVFPLVAWWLVGLPSDAGGFFFFVFTCFWTLTCANAYVMMFSAFVPNFMIGNSAITATFAFMFLFSGYFIPKTDIPDWWIWFYYLSIFKYAFDAFLGDIYGLLADQKWGVPGAAGPTPDAYYTTAELAAQSGYGGTNKWAGIGGLVGFWVLYRILFYVALRLRNKGTRK